MQDVGCESQDVEAADNSMQGSTGSEDSRLESLPLSAVRL